MRTIGEARKAFDMMCERALSRVTAGERLADKQMVQEKIADSWIELEQFRLLVLRTAWRIDKLQDYRKVRQGHRRGKGSDAKGAERHRLRAGAADPRLDRRLHYEMPVRHRSRSPVSYVMGLADGPTEVHKITLAKQVLRDHRPTNELFPSYSLLNARDRALDKYPELEEAGRRRGGWLGAPGRARRRLRDRARRPREDSNR